MTGLLKRLCKCSNDVPDLRQETYIRVCESAAKSRSRSPKAFLLATARNLAFDKLRRERLVPVSHVSNVALLDFSIDELTPERRRAAQQDLHRLTRAFASLPANTKSVIWLRCVSGLSQREAATALGIDEGTLEGHMARGMRRLAHAIPEGMQENAWLRISDLSKTTRGRPYPKAKMTAFGVRRGKAALSQWVRVPPGEMLQPEATGATVEVTKRLKPSVKRATKYGGSASVQAATQVNAEQASKRRMRGPGDGALCCI